jgi:hypothetical protein
MKKYVRKFEESMNEEGKLLTAFINYFDAIDKKTPIKIDFEHIGRKICSFITVALEGSSIGENNSELLLNEFIKDIKKGIQKF